MNNYPTWRAAHCLQCWQQPTECEICGCHIDPETVAPQRKTDN